MLPSGGFPRIALAVVGLLAAALILAVAAVPSAAQSHLFSNLAQSAIILWATFCAFAAARRASSPYFRHLWRLLGVALAMAAAGQVGVSYYGSILQTSRGTPWPSDVLLFVWVAPAAMMLLPRRSDESRSARWERTLDFAQIGIVFVTAYLYFFYVPSLWEARNMVMFRSMLEAAVARDALLAAAFLVRSATLPRSPARSFFARVSGFFVLLGIAESLDISYFDETARAAAWADAAWALPFAFIVVLAATWSAAPEPQPEPQASDQTVWVVSQILPVSIPLLVIYMGGRIAREQITIAALAIAASFGCSAARLLLTSQRQRRIANDLRRAEHAARQSEQMFSAAFRSSPDAITISLFPEGNVVELNESFTKVTGYSRADALGKTPQDLGLWADPAHMEEIRARFRELGSIHDEEFRFRRKDGELRFGRISASTISLDSRVCALIIVGDITERKLAEDALRATEERFRSLVRDLQVGVVLLRPDGEIQYTNPAAAEMFGLLPEQFEGKKVSEFGLTALHEDGSEMPLSLRPVARAIDTRLPIRGEVMGWQRRDSGEILWILGNAIPQLNEAGEVTSVIASFADITALRKVQEALRLSEERFRSLVQTLRVGISTWGPDGRLQFMNQAMIEMFGPPREQILGKKSHEIMQALREDGSSIPPELRPAARVIATRQPVRNEVIGWPLPSSKEVIWTLVDAVPEIAPDGRLVRVIASLINITDLKRAEEEKRLSQEMFAKAFHSSPDSMTISTLADGRYVEVNDGYSRLFGWSREEVLGKSAVELGLWPDPAGRGKFMNQVLNLGRTSQFEADLRVKSGEMRSCLLSADIIVLNGQTCVLTVARDITEQKQRALALQQLSARLLQLQDEERRRLGRDLHDSLAQSVLAVNLSIAQVTQSSAGLDERNRQVLANARGILQDMSRQIRTLSYLLHPPLLDELGLASTVKEYAEGFSERSGIELELEISPEFGRLPQDAETALFRIVQESLANIQRHSGSPTARIRLLSDAAGVNLEVSDRGHGMPQGKAQNPALPGARLGVGILGMRERLTQLGGELEIESSGSGTTVRARIPLPAGATHALSNSSRG